MPSSGELLLRRAVKLAFDKLRADFDPMLGKTTQSEGSAPIFTSSDSTGDVAAGADEYHCIGLPYACSCSLYQDFRAMALFEHYYLTRPHFTDNDSTQAALVNQILFRIPDWSKTSTSHAPTENLEGRSQYSHLSKCETCGATTGKARSTVKWHLRLLQKSLHKWKRIKGHISETEASANGAGGERDDLAGSSNPCRTFDQLLSRVKSCDNFTQALDCIIEAETLFQHESDSHCDRTEFYAEELLEQTRGARSELDIISSWIGDNWDRRDLPTWRDALQGVLDDHARQNGRNRQVVVTDVIDTEIDAPTLTLSSSDFEDALDKNTPIEEHDFDFEW